MGKTKQVFCIWIALFFVIFITGCVSLPQNQKYSELEDRVTKIEGRVEEIAKVNAELQKKSAAMEQKVYTQKLADKVDPAKRAIRFPSNEDIQTALKNAGIYDGKIDGQIGTKTREAIKEFQKQNDLEVDGVVGRNTWETLSKFYYAPAKAVSEAENKEEQKVEVAPQVEVSD